MLRPSTAKALSALLVLNIFSAGVLPCLSQDIAQDEGGIGASSAFVFKKPRKSKQNRYLTSDKFASNFKADRFVVSKSRLETQAQSSLTSNGRVRTRPLEDGAVTSIQTPSSPTAKARASETYAGVGERQLSEGEYDEAVKSFETALSYNPQNTAAVLAMSEALTRKGRALLEADSPDEASLAFKSAVEKDPKNAVAYSGLGLVSEKVSNYTDAAWNYERALVLDPKLTELYARLGSVYIRQGELAKADEMLQRAALSDPNDPSVQLDLAFLELKANKGSVAVERMRRVVSRDSDSAEARYFLGAALAETGKEGDAESEYQKALAIDPGYVPALYDLGVAKYNDGRYAEAASSYETIALREPSNSLIRSNLGDAYRQLGDFEKANENYSVAAETVKDDPDLYTSWGYTLGMTDRWDESIAALTSASEVRPEGLTGSNLGWAYFNAAQKDAESGNQDEAQKKWATGRKILEAAVEMDPNLAPAFLNLGSTLNRLGDFKAAVGALLRASDMKRDWLPALNELGTSYRRLGKLAEAIGSFQRVVDLNEKFRGALYNLGEAQFAAGLKKDAEKTLKRLKAVDPDGAARLQGVIEGRIRDKIDEVNPLKKVPKLPF